MMNKICANSKNVNWHMTYFNNMYLKDKDDSHLN